MINTDQRKNIKDYNSTGDSYTSVGGRQIDIREFKDASNTPFYPVTLAQGVVIRIKDGKSERLSDFLASSIAYEKVVWDPDASDWKKQA